MRSSLEKLLLVVAYIMGMFFFYYLLDDILVTPFSHVFSSSDLDLTKAWLRFWTYVLLTGVLVIGGLSIRKSNPQVYLHPDGWWSTLLDLTTILCISLLGIASFILSSQLKSPYLGFLLGLLVLVGLGIYITRGSKYRPQTMVQCARCGREVSVNYKWCPYCQFPIHGRCLNCGKPIEEGYVYCPYCFVPISKQGLQAMLTSTLETESSSSSS